MENILISINKFVEQTNQFLHITLGKLQYFYTEFITTSKQLIVEFTVAVKQSLTTLFTTIGGDEMDIFILSVELATIFILLVFIFFVLIPLAVYFNARVDKQFTTLPEGEIKYIVSGDTLKRTLINIPGFYLEGEGMEAEIKNIKEIDDPIKRARVEEQSQTHRDPGLPLWLSKILGLNEKRIPIYFVGIDYPKTRIHSYQFIWEKFIRELSGYKVEHRDEWVNSLYWRYPYPVQSKDIDLKGNFQADIIIIATIQVVHPYKPVFVYKGKWFSPVIAAINGAVANYARSLSFDELREDQKEGREAKLVKAVEAINNVLIATYGVEVANVDFVSLDPSKGQQEVIKALTAVEIARLKADAKIKEAEGDRQAAILRRSGEAEGLEKLLETAQKHEDAGYKILQTDLGTRNLGQKSNLQTIVLSGKESSILPAISIDPKKKSSSVSEEISQE